MSLSEKRTRKPCHGCGELGLRPSEGLCSTCRRRLDRAESILREHEKRAERGVFRHAHVAHWNPGFYAPSYSIGYETRDRLRRALHETIMLAGEPTTGVHRGLRLLEGCGNNDHQHGYDGNAVIMAPELAHAFRELFHAIEGAIEDAYQDGRERGGDLLASVAAGDVTLDQYQDRLARRSKALRAPTDTEEP